jgi:signal transduction histidine kinase
MVMENLLHGLFFLIYLGLAFYVLYKNRKALLNRSVFLLMLITSFQSLSVMVIRYPTIDIVTANVFTDILSISMTAFGILAFLSIVFLTRLFKPNLFIYLLLSMYLIGFAIFQLSTDFASVSEKDRLGLWIIEFNNSSVLFMLDIIHNILLIAGFILLFVFIKKTSDYLKRNQVIIILIAGLISYAFSLMNILIPAFIDEVRLLLLNDIFLSIFLIGFIYSIVKYELFEITPSMAVEQIIEILPVGLIIADINEDIIRTNKSLCAITQRPEKFFLKKNVSSVFKNLTNKNITEILKNKGVFENIEINTKPEKNKTVSTFYKKLLDKFGRPIGSITLIHDINELVRTQKLLNNSNILLEKKVKKRTHELYLAKEKAEESNKLKTAFLQNISHEIRTPLNAISGFSGLLNTPDLSKEKRKKFVSIIQNSSNQLASIVTDILTISSLETKQIKSNIDKVCINRIIKDLLVTFKQQAIKDNISLYAKQPLPEKQSEIFTDKTKLIQILTNLINNALKFTPQGFIEFGYSLINNNLEFYVKDSGIGIDPKYHEKIFERFGKINTSTTKLYGGTGIGLPISKEYVELLGGKIWVLSETDKGSSFYFTIPYKPVFEIDNNPTPIK